jgi:predicted ABC-type transport system involved in lysophospholipase L1 biosynthesis ATPase subunit
MVDAAAPILETRDVVKHFAAGAHAVVHAVDVVTLSINRGETFAIVGESGCGKSTLARLLLRLIEPTSGQVLYEGQDLTAMPLDALRRVRADIQFIFQDPFSSLNPRMTVGALIGEPLLVHTRLTRFEREARVANLLRQVGLRPEHAEHYPHEFSGGQRQRDRRDLPEVVGRGNAHHAEKRGKGERDATWQPGRSRLLVDRNMCQRSFGQHEVAGERPGEGRKPIESPIRTEVDGLDPHLEHVAGLGAHNGDGSREEVPRASFRGRRLDDRAMGRCYMHARIFGREDAPLSVKRLDDHRIARLNRQHRLLRGRKTPPNDGLGCREKGVDSHVLVLSMEINAGKSVARRRQRLQAPCRP